jgi:hypothetical protein
LGRSLLVFASAVILGAGSIGTHDSKLVHDNIFVRSKTIYAFGNGSSSLKRGKVGLSELATFVEQ